MEKDNSIYMLIKKNITNCILIVLSVILAISISELFCWLLNVPPKEKGHHKLFCEYDPLLGWKHKSSTTAFYTTSEYRVKESFNSKGIRGPEYPYEKSNVEFRILILGDSFAEGYTVDFENLFSEIINKGLKNKKVVCTVINAGTGGYSTDQELLFFKNEGRKYKPDLTILMFNDNDVWYNNQPKYIRGYKPLFKVVERNLILTNIPCPKPDINKPKVSPESKNVKEWLLDHSRVYNLIRNFIRDKRRLFKAPLEFRLVQEPNLEKVPEECKILEKDYNSEFKNAWNVTEAIIVELNKETSSINSKLLVFHVPYKMSIYERDWQVFKKQYGISDQEWDRSQGGLILKNICKKHNIDFIDPTESFKMESNKFNTSGKCLYFSHDGHWNILGHNLVGNLLSDFIYKNYLKNNI